MVSQLENAGLSFVGRDETGRRMEVSFYKSRAVHCILQNQFNLLETIRKVIAVKYGSF